LKHRKTVLHLAFDSACDAPHRHPKISIHPLVEAEMLANKVGYLATGLAFLFIGAVTFGFF
jgi:hypothetical protein